MMTMTRTLLTAGGLLWLAVFPSSAVAVEFPYQFAAGTPAVAAQVNANFDAVGAAADGNAARIAELEDGLTALQALVESQAQQIAQLDATLSALQANSVLELDGHTELVTDANGYLTVRFTGVNVQLVNGVAQDVPNGVGNLIVGYNEQRLSGEPVCSDGSYSLMVACVSLGHLWAVNHKSGSHNIVGGSHNAYSATGGLVVGRDNVITGAHASVSGGYESAATGRGSSVSGGFGNHAMGVFSSVSGGGRNSAEGAESSVGGGEINRAVGELASISGGLNNRAWGAVGSISGGIDNLILTETLAGTISGGMYRQLPPGTGNWRAGELYQAD